ncbi:hypothetical protein LIER_21243 [Lithospermum erythrorhizon]|uniref:Uncharacterized protein n=1 Tax=Lithospermum erythrorhizon TaxID=34254 RepID=A0AAV3QTP6_LITER
MENRYIALLCSESLHAKASFNSVPPLPRWRLSCWNDVGSVAILPASDGNLGPLTAAQLQQEDNDESQEDKNKSVATQTRTIGIIYPVQLVEEGMRAASLEENGDRKTVEGRVIAKLP